MIIDISEYLHMGFDFDLKNEDLLENCLKRAEIVLNAISGGRIYTVMANSQKSAELIRQAAALEANALFNAELNGNLSRVSLGDLSYTESAKGDIINVPDTVKKLLAAAGCFRGAGITEVIE